MFSLIARKFICSICNIYLIFAFRIRQDMTKRRETNDNIRVSNGPKNKFGSYTFNLSRWSSLRKYVFCFKDIFVYLSDITCIGSLRILIKKKRRKAQSRLIFSISFTKTVLYITRVFSILLSFFDSKRSIF